jgi:hypothetical protein
MFIFHTRVNKFLVWSVKLGVQILVTGGVKIGTLITIFF